MAELNAPSFTVFMWFLTWFQKQPAATTLPTIIDHTMSSLMTLRVIMTATNGTKLNQKFGRSFSSTSWTFKAGPVREVSS